ncbi:MAG: hypothetical protein HW421_1273 [Ignavibacteria bacterium]|nr:hypothetical protein [Ignavibacteria bacterium]
MILESKKRTKKITSDIESNQRYGNDFHKIERLKFNFFIALFILLSLNLPYSSFAQDKKELTIDDCLKIGMENSKLLKISRSKLKSAESKSKEANAAALPSLKLNAGYSRLSEIERDFSSFSSSTLTSGTASLINTFSPLIYNNYNVRLTLSQPVFTGFRLSASSNLQKHSAEATTKDFDKDKSQLVFDIKNNFWSYYKANEMRKSIEENISQTQAHLADVESFYKNGMATNNEVLKVKVQLSNLQILKIDAENLAQITMMALNNTLGMPVLTNTELKASVDFKESTQENLNQLVSTAVTERPEINAMKYRVKMGEDGIRIAKSGWYPQINFLANFYYLNPNQRIFPMKDEFNGTWDLGFNLSFDLWNWQTYEHQTQQAVENLNQATLGLEQLKDAITLEVAQSYSNLFRSKEKISVSQDAVKQAEENYRVTNEKFKSGVAINSDLLDAESALLNAKINLATAIADYEISLAKLERTIAK